MNHAMKRFFCTGFLFPWLWVTAELVVDLPVEEVTETDLEGVDAPEAHDHQPGQEPEWDELSFFNGNVLSGRLESMTPDRVTWRHPDVEAPIAFDPANLKRIELIAQSAKAEELTSLARIQLVNGDSVRGELVKLGEEQLELTSPALGAFQVQRAHLQTLEVQTGDQILYQGPKQGEWSFKNHRGDNNSWMWMDGSLVAPGQNLSASLEPKGLPDRITVSLEMEWRGNLNASLAFWGGDTENPNHNCYTLGLQHHYIRIHRNFQKHGHSNIANQQLQPQMERGRVAMTLHLDKRTKSIVLLLDNALIGQWRDMADFPIRGDQFMFYNQSNSPLRISKIQIETWDGELVTQKRGALETTDEIQTVSGDLLTGTVLNIGNGVLTFRSEFADLDIPLDRLQRIQFAASTRKEPEPIDQPVVIESVTGDRLTLDLDALEAGVFKGSNPTMGLLEFQADYAKEVTLNPADPRQEEKDWAWMPGN
jgi:hypothetical protein